MSEEFIPAWKKLGLKVKETDPLAVGIIGSEQRGTINKRKRQVSNQTVDSSTTEKGPKKPPKRVKLPKNERPPPPESDQLVYLKQYHGDRENWKFSKQKQNWILKNLYTIGEPYSQELDSYINGLVGGSRGRVIEEAKKVVEEWNVFMTKEDEKEKEEEKEVINDENIKDDSEKKTKVQKKEPVVIAPDEAKAVRARHFVEVLTGEKLNLQFIDEVTNEKEVIEKKNEKDESEVVIEKEEKEEEEEKKKDKKGKKEKKDKQGKKEKKEKKEKKDREEK